jgi:class 3 adenylate cyclase/YHS domain-containing protein
MVEAFDTAIADVVATLDRRAPPLGLGAGIATGSVILANVGSTARMDYTAIGAPVNLAARLCAEAGAREVLCDLATARSAASGWRSVPSTTRELHLKGMRRAVRARVFRVRSRPGIAPARDAVDPVCGMKVSPSTTFERRYRGRFYRFCSPGCRERFGRAPARFATAAGRR